MLLSALYVRGVLRMDTYLFRRRGLNEIQRNSVPIQATWAVTSGGAGRLYPATGFKQLRSDRLPWPRAFRGRFVWAFLNRRLKKKKKSA